MSLCWSGAAYFIFVVGGGLPVVPKRPSAQKKPWQQDKIAHNPLDSTSPLVKKGKQREVPKAKKPTPLKKVSPPYPKAKVSMFSAVRPRLLFFVCFRSF